MCQPQPPRLHPQKTEGDPRAASQPCTHTQEATRRITTTTTQRHGSENGKPAPTRSSIDCSPEMGRTEMVPSRARISPSVSSRMALRTSSFTATRSSYTTDGQVAGDEATNTRFQGQTPPPATTADAQSRYPILVLRDKERLQQQKKNPFQPSSLGRNPKTAPHLNESKHWAVIGHLQRVHPRVESQVAVGPAVQDAVGPGRTALFLARVPVVGEEVVLIRRRKVQRALEEVNKGLGWPTGEVNQGRRNGCTCAVTIIEWPAQSADVTTEVTAQQLVGGGDESDMNTFCCVCCCRSWS